MLVVHQPPDTAWPQASPRLAPWVPYVLSIQSLCGCFGASTLHPHPWCHLLFPSVYDEGNCQAAMVQHLHTHDRLSLCVVTPKHVFWVNISKNTKKINNSKNLKSGFEIHYLCRHMPLLGVGAYPDLHGSLSLHRGSCLWWWSISATMERNLLGRS